MYVVVGVNPAPRPDHTPRAYVYRTRAIQEGKAADATVRFSPASSCLCKGFLQLGYRHGGSVKRHGVPPFTAWVIAPFPWVTYWNPSGLPSPRNQTYGVFMERSSPYVTFSPNFPHGPCRLKTTGFIYGGCPLALWLDGESVFLCALSVRSHLPILIIGSGKPSNDRRKSDILRWFSR